MLLLWFRDFRRKVLSPSHQVLEYCPPISSEMAIAEQLPCADVLFGVTFVDDAPHFLDMSKFVNVGAQFGCQLN